MRNFNKAKALFASMTKEFILNRKKQKIAIIVEESSKSKGLAFVMHGLSGNKEQPHIRLMAEVLRDNNYTSVRFDTTNTFGESDGNFEDATITNYFEDLEDVISWASKQKWYREPFILAGQSLGGICTTLYAEKFPEKVKGLAPKSTVVNWELSKESKSMKRLEKWKKDGINIWKSNSGRIKRLKWAFVEDRMKYDILKKANLLKMPVLLIVGDKDTSTTPKSQKAFYDALPGRKEIHIVKNAPHTFSKKKHLEELKTYFDAWIKSL